MAAPDPSVVLVDGPWAHRDVNANGVRFHVAETGPADGPLIVLLHGFPEFWWSWRHQLVGLAAEGYHVAAVDLRGFGASDKPPRGYDAYTLSADVAGLVRALGSNDAVLVGHDWGGALAWSAATLHPQVVRKLVIVSVAHPLRMRAAMLTEPRGQMAASSYFLRFQVPALAERQLLAEDAAMVERLLRTWGGPGFPDDETAIRCREAMQIQGAAHSGLEYYRWAVRSLLRPSGQRWHRLLSTPIPIPTLQIHGDLDTCVLTDTALGSGRYVGGVYEWLLVPDAGHFVHQEKPDLVTKAIADWSRP